MHTQYKGTWRVYLLKNNKTETKFLKLALKFNSVYLLLLVLFKFLKLQKWRILRTVHVTRRSRWRGTLNRGLGSWRGALKIFCGAHFGSNADRTRLIITIFHKTQHSIQISE